MSTLVNLVYKIDFWGIFRQNIAFGGMFPENKRFFFLRYGDSGDEWHACDVQNIEDCDWDANNIDLRNKI